MLHNTVLYYNTIASTAISIHLYSNVLELY